MRSLVKYAAVANLAHPLELQMGGILSDVKVAYETYGQLSKNKDNVILVTHALTGDSHAASHSELDKPGWWEDLIGPGRSLDTNRFYVICSNVLGGCSGTTGPSSTDPASGRPYGMAFPAITIRDMVRVQKRLLKQLGIHHLVMVIGGSMGGMQALEWAVTYPEFMNGVVAIAAPGYSTAQSIAYNKVGRDAVMLDPLWRNGEYYGTEGPQAGLSLARALGMITYQSEQSMAAKFNRRERGGQFEVEHYLDYQGQKLVDRFDANSYLYMLKALDLHDLGAGYTSYEAALARIEARVLTIGVSSDILYPPYQQAEVTADMRSVGVRAEYVEISSRHGHDGFLIDFHLLKPLVTKFVNTVTPAEQPWSASFFRAPRLAYVGACLASEV